MPRLPLVPLLLAAVAVLGVPAEAVASCGGATRALKREICPPTASFTASATSVLPGATVDFDASTSTTQAPWTITQYAWDFGDGTPVETHGPGDWLTSHTFATRGKRTVTLTVTDSGGQTRPYSATISVTDPPVAALAVSDDTPLSLTDVTIDASGSSDPDGLALDEYAFDLDAHPDFETEASNGGPVLTHAFATSGPRTIRVRVTDADGATAIATRSVVVENRAPAASITAPALALAGQPAGLSAAGSTDPDGTVTHYAWDLDGETGYEVDGGTSPTLAHTWPTAGDHTVGLQVTDNGGTTATATVVVNVKAGPSAAIVATPQQPLPGEAVTLDATGSGDADGPITYTWDLDGDGEFERVTGTTATTETTFPAAGVVTVRVRVRDSDGLLATASTTVTIKQLVTDGGGSGGDSTTTGGAGGGGGSTTPTTSSPGAGAGASGPAPSAPTPPASPQAAPRADTGGPARAAGPALDARAIQKLRTILKSGVQMACRGAAETRCTIRVEVDKATAKRLKLGRTRILATATLRGQRTGTTTVKLSAKTRRLLGKARSVRLLVRGVSTAEDGSTTQISRVVLARR